MNQKMLAILSAIAVLISSTISVFAAEAAKSVNLPGGVAWALVILAIVLVVVTNSFLRKRN